MRHIIRYNSNEAHIKALEAVDNNYSMSLQFGIGQTQTTNGLKSCHVFYTKDREELNTFVKNIDIVFSGAGLKLRDYSIITEGV